VYDLKNIFIGVLIAFMLPWCLSEYNRSGSEVETLQVQFLASRCDDTLTELLTEAAVITPVMKTLPCLLFITRPELSI